MDVEKKEEKGGEEYKMKVKLIKQNKTQGTASFILGDTTPFFANLLRRTIINKVPTLAIEDVEFKSNDSVLYDEMIAHRLGMLPISTDLKTYTLQKDCKCEGAGCARCTLTLTIKEKGPKTIYASDLKSKDPKANPIFPKTPIVKLSKDQKLEIIATAILGQGKEHIKWSPGSAWYKYQPSVTVNNQSKELEKFKDKFPSQIFDKSGKINKQKIIDLDLYEACDQVCEDIVKIGWDENNIIFYVESWGQLTVKEMVKSACEIIDKEFEEFSNKFSKL